MVSADPGQGRRFAELWERIDAAPRLGRLARFVRGRTPGDARDGDPLSVAGDDPAAVLGRRPAALGAQRPSMLRELGFGALQLWQNVSEARGLRVYAAAH